MNLLISFIYILIFLFFMAFVFSIGLLRPYMPKKELVIVFVAAFVIGSLGGAFFLTPVHDSLPEFAYEVEKLVPSNQDKLTVDIPYSSDVNSILTDLNSMEGVKSANVTGATIYLSKLTDNDVSTINNALSIIDSNYVSWHVNKSGQIDIQIKDNSSISSALQSFSDWYNLVYGVKVGSATVHIDVVVSSSHVDDVEDYLIKHNIVPSNRSGPSFDAHDNMNHTLLSTNQFIVCCGIFGVVVSLLGVYFDNIVVSFKKFKRWVGRNRKR